MKNDKALAISYILATVYILLLVIVWSSNQPKIEQKQEQRNITAHYADDWYLGLFRGYFRLVRRLDKGYITEYEVTYHGNNIVSDLKALGEALGQDVLVMVQSNSNEEVITWMYEDMEVIKVE